MGFRTFFHIGLVRRIRDDTNDNTQSQQPESGTDLPRRRSRRIASGFRKALTIHRRHDSGINSATGYDDQVAPSLPPMDRLHHLELSEKQEGFSNYSDVEAPPIETKTALKSESSPLSTNTYNTLTSQLSTPSARETLPTTVSFSAPGVDNTKDSILHSHELNEYEVALAGLSKASKLLFQRHATIQQQPASPNQKPNPLGTIVCKTTPKPITRSAIPPHITSPAYRRRQPPTAQEACEALQRRQLIKNLAYNGIHDIDDAVLILQQLKAHLALQARHRSIPDLVLQLSGVQVRASQLGPVERRWILRFFALQNISHLVARRAVGAEDYDTITAQLFPDSRQQLLKLEYFDIFMTGLGEEEIIPLQEARRIARLGVSIEEFDSGARYTGPSLPHNHYHCNASTLSIFDIPHRPSPSTPSYSFPSPLPQQDLYPHLRILVEAAVYSQRFWKSFFFPSPRSRLQSFHTAHRLSSLGRTLPTHLAPFARPWSPRAARLLARGTILCDLLARHETGTLTDFGLLRAVRAALVHIPGQPVFSPRDLERVLYHRVCGSGLRVASVPGIVALHPAFDAICGAEVETETETEAKTEKEEVWRDVLQGLRERADVFQKEEEERECAQRAPTRIFAAQRRVSVGRWETVWRKWRERFGSEQEEKGGGRFDPFAVQSGDGRLCV